MITGVQEHDVTAEKWKVMSQDDERQTNSGTNGQISQTYASVEEAAEISMLLR